MVIQNNKEVTYQGSGFLGLLTIVFIVLKLIGVISWSWWLVTLPMWIGPAILLGIGLFALVLYVVYKTFFEGYSYSTYHRRRQYR